MTKSGYPLTGSPYAISLLAFETQTIRFWTRVIHFNDLRLYESAPHWSFFLTPLHQFVPQSDQIKGLLLMRDAMLPERLNLPAVTGHPVSCYFAFSFTSVTLHPAFSIAF